MTLNGRTISSAAALLILFEWGCTSIPQRPGFADVEHRIDERTGLRVTWDEQTPADGRVRETVSALNKRVGHVGTPTGTPNSPKLVESPEH